jgi:hypothetical protein
MRETLPNRREIETFRFEHKGIKHFASFSRFHDGRIAEVFLDAGKVGSDAQLYARDAAVVLSIALQFGADLEVMRQAVTRDDKGAPAGPLGVLLDMLAVALKPN